MFMFTCICACEVTPRVLSPFSDRLPDLRFGRYVSSKAKQNDVANARESWELFIAAEEIEIEV